MLFGHKFWSLFFFILLGLFVACSPAADEPIDRQVASFQGVVAEGEETLIPILPTLVPTAARILPTLTAIPTLDVPPTYTPSSSATPEPEPSETPLPPTNTPAPVSQNCPVESPAVPDYQRFNLGTTRWPEPNEALTDHLWLDKPLPGGGRYLINTTFPYGWDGSGAYILHNGVDTGAPLGTPLLAVGDGTVIVAQSDENKLFGWRCDWYGQLVVIELDQQWLGQPIFALYGHVLNIMVEPGDEVIRGQQLAEVGFGGAAIVPHLHFEVRVGSNEYENTRNPMLWVRPPESRGLIAGRLIDSNGYPWEGVWMMAQSLTNSDTEYVTWSYLDDPRNLIKPDARYGENFVFTDMRPGRYRIYIEVNDKRYTADVEVVGGEISTVEIVTN
ncbi:MAG: peptidoglycan DD-metalloendopeptidase family protein [Chloroflexota bacterium]